jgi:undecaprenyl-diphosphatase
MTNIDSAIFLFINQRLAHPVLDFLVLKILIPLFFLLGIVPFFMTFLKKYRQLGVFSLLSGLISYILGDLLKYFFQQPRPFDILGARTIGPWHAGSFSFPSSTTMLAFGLALPFLLERSRFRYFFLILAILVGFSVIYTGFHFPKDVIGGISFSILIVFLLNKIKNYISKNQE